jgi:VCBS repeat-containing protein
MMTYRIKYHALLLLFAFTFSLLIIGWLLIRPVYAAGEYIVECPADGNGSVDTLKSAITAVTNAPQQYSSLVISITGADCLFTLVSVHGETFNGPIGLPGISSNMTIRAVGGRAIIERSPSAPAFRLLESSGQLTLENITLRNGKATSKTSSMYYGGAIYANSALTLTDVLLTENSGDFGGAVYANGKLVMDHVTISHNRPNREYDGKGGGILAANDLLATNITVTNNLMDMRGGGIYVEGNAVISTAFFEANQAHHYNGIGGALYVVGDLTLTNSSIISNSSGARGGGIYVEGASTFLDVHFARNVTNDAGGGIHAPSSKIATIEASTFISNHAGSGAGVSVYHAVVKNSLFEDNIAKGTNPFFGGGALLVVSDANIQNSRFIRNSAPIGGGVQLIFYPPEGVTGGSRIINNLWIDNDAVLGNGSAVAIGLDVDPLPGSYVEFTHNTVTRHTRNTGSGVYAARSSVDVYNNIIERHRIGVHTTKSTALMDGNLFFDNVSNFVGVEAGPNDLTGDPKFVDAANHDYHLQPGSPAQDSGMDAGIADDFDGLSRPQGKGYDRGAFEIEFTNSAPIAQADAYTTSANSALSVDLPGVLANDADPDGDSLTVTLANAPAHGELTLQLTGGFIYTPTKDFTGTDSFTYQANDGTALSPAATVTIQVKGTDTNDDDDGPQPVPISGLTVSHDGPAVVGETVHFTASVATGSNVIIGWDFGDGARRVDPQVTHIYSEPGTYTVTTIATNTVNFQLSFTNVVVLDEPAAQQQIFTPFIVK